MKTRDEYLKKELDIYEKKINNGLITGYSLQKIIEQADLKFCGDYLESKQPDILHKWKILRKGDMVLNIDTFDLGSVVFNSSDILEIKFPKYSIIIKYLGDISYLDKLQLIQTGPFSADKVKVGDWVWVERNDTIFGYLSNGWHPIINTEKLITVKGVEPLVWGFTRDGKCSGDCPDGARLHFSPPSPPKDEAIEKAKEKVIGLIAEMKLGMTTADFHKELTAILTEFKETGR